MALKLDGLNVDAVYENFVRQIAGDKLQPSAPAETLKESVERDQQKRLLQRQIEVLKAKIRKERQLNRQMEMNSELKKLKKQMEAL